MSNNLYDRYSNNNFYYKIRTIATNYNKKIRHIKYNPYKPKKSNSLNKNSFSSWINTLKKETLTKKKTENRKSSENRKGFNYGNLSISTKYKERLKDSFISNSINIVNEFPNNKNVQNNLTKYQWYTNTKKEDNNKILNLMNYENKTKEKNKNYFPRNSKIHNLYLNKNYFKADFELEEKNSGTNNHNFHSNKNFIKSKLEAPDDNINLLIEDKISNMNLNKLEFTNDKQFKKKSFRQFKKFDNILPMILQRSQIENLNHNKIIDKNDLLDPQIIGDEIKSDISLCEYYNFNCELIKNYAYKENPNIDYRIYMEDKSRSIINLNQDKSNSLFCLFDGHGGQEISNYLQINFHVIMKEHFPFDLDNYELFFYKLFYDIDLKLWSLKYFNVGSTASIIYIKLYQEKKYIYCANIGDSRVLLIKSREYKRLSYDDRVSDANEFNRITKGGGLIIDNRVYGQLMLSRSFGDFELKHVGVICEPHVTRIEIGLDDLFVVMASDGVWDVLDEIEIYGMSSNIKNSKEFCDTIVNTAIEKGSKDNISCFVLQLN